MYAAHLHDLFYITVKYHQNITNGFKVIEQTRNGQTDGRQAHRYKKQPLFVHNIDLGIHNKTSNSVMKKVFDSRPDSIHS